MLPVNRYQRHESVTPAILPAERILDPEGAFVESTQAQGAEVDVPLTVVDLDQAEVLLVQGLAHVDPLLVPANPAVAAHSPHFAVAGILQRGQPGDAMALVTS